MAKRVAVIGGGAAGLMAACSARTQGAAVTIYEAGAVLGKKLLSTGNGKCNFTNQRMRSDCYRSRQPGAAMEAIRFFGVKQTLSFFRGIGIQPTMKNGCVYPRSEQAVSVRDALVRECERRGVRIVTGAKVSDLSKEDGVFQLNFASGDEIKAEGVILAAGGKAAPKTGSDGRGYLLAEQMGHRIIPVVPALVQLHTDDAAAARWQGVRTQGKIRLVCGRKILAEDSGELQLAEKGISGIPVFQVSRYASYALAQGKDVTAELDFLPGYEREEWEKSRKMAKHVSAADFLRGYFPEKLARVIARRAGVPEEIGIGKLSGEQSFALYELCRKFCVHITGTHPFEQAQVCAGGVSTREVDLATMESRRVPGLYFAGEILDVDGICGGYNLQWAWSSGYLAGIHAGKEEV